MFDELQVKTLQQVNDFRGHSTSFEMAWIDRPYDTSYISGL